MKWLQYCRFVAYDNFWGNAVLTRGFSTRQGVDGSAELLQSGLRVQVFKNRQVFNAVKRLLGDGVFSEVDVKIIDCFILSCGDD